MKKIHPENPSLRNPEWARQIFDNARRPAAWLHVGAHLRSSAEAIFTRENPIAERFQNEQRRLLDKFAADGSTEDFDQARYPFPNFEGAYVLVAFALENLLKGIVVAKGRVNFVENKLPAKLHTHKLVALHKLAEPKATVEHHILDSLTHMAEWRGRYPLPSSIEGFWPTDSNGNLTVSGLSWPTSHHRFLEYCHGLEAELQALI